MARRYLGYGITNSNGVATLDHDPNGNVLTHSYTGVGAGELDIVAESGTLQSEIYEVTDCFIVDTGITGTYNQYNIDTDVTVDSNHDNGTLLSNTKETGNARRIFNNNNIGTDGRDITSAFCLEFKIVSFTGRTDFNFYQSSPYTNISDVFNTNNSAIHDGCTVKIVHDGAKYTCYVDDEAVTGLINKPHEWNTGLFAFMMRPSANIKYRDFKVYPI